MTTSKALVSRILFLLVVTSLWAAAPASAQDQSQTARSFIPSPAVLGMGGAGTAISSPEMGFFYNPAALVSADDSRMRIHILGLRAEATRNILDQVKFYQDDIQPAIDEGIENMSQESLNALYDEAMLLGQRTTAGGADVLLPNVIVQLKEVGAAAGGGLFTHSFLRYQASNAGAGVPAIDMVARGDIQALAGGALNLANYGIDGLSAGLTAKYTRRYLTLKARPLDAAIEDNLYLFAGQSVGFDLGLLYRIPISMLPGTLQAGLAVFDIVASDFNYAYDRSLATGQPDNQDRIAAEETLANEVYALHPSFRAGLAFELTEIPVILDQTVVALDYVGYASPARTQSFLTHLNMGAQTRIANLFVLRAGLSQGYTTFGLGVTLPFVHVNYAYYGTEEGRFPGQAPSWHHAVKLSFGLL